MRKILTPVLAVLVCSALWSFRPTTDNDQDITGAAGGLSFERATLPRAESNQRHRPVQPALEAIQPWISAVGASVGALDLRGQGHAGDGCLTDPRDDKVRVFPIPGSSGEPFEEFELEPEGLRYDTTMAPIGCVPTDINRDGAMDIVVYYWGRSPVVFTNQRPAGSDQPPRRSDFEAHELVSPMQVWNTTALNFADVDGDGNLDIIVGNYFPDGARVLDTTATSDDRMEMQHSMSKARNAGTNRLFLGSSVSAPGEMPAFTDVSDRLPADSADSWTLAVGFQHLSGTGVPDAYVANDFGPDQLLVNRSTPGDVRLENVRGNRDLTQRKSTVLGHDSFKGMGVAYSYEAGEDLPALFVSNITSSWALHESNFAFYPAGSGSDLLNGDMPFRDRSAQTGIAYSGWAWDIKAVDLSNRGQDDLVQATGFIQGDRDVWPRLQETAMGNDLILSDPRYWLRIEDGDSLSGYEPNRLWRRNGDSWVDVGEKVTFSDDEVSRGISTGDFNGDGVFDFLVANQWQDSFAYINTTRSTNKSLSLRVVNRGVDDNQTPVIGAEVTLEGKDGYSRKSQVFPANGHSGVSDSLVHFGIPSSQAEAALTAKVVWTEDGEQRQQEFELEDSSPGEVQTLEVGE